MSVVAAVQILAIAAHRDDVEQTCGGTLLKMAQAGYRTAILDLTQGELGTRGTVAERAAESIQAAHLLQVNHREALDIPDGRVENTHENRVKIARVVRRLQPDVVILPYWQARHPDHYNAAALGYESCFYAGLKKFDLQSRLAPHRPFKIIYASLYADVRPTFVVDITQQFEARLASLFAYRSQYEDRAEGSGIFVRAAEIRGRIESMASHYGVLAGVKYGEPFVQKEVGLVDDITSLPVRSF
ncbi:MAG: bacillithiol biosynthesis deacetylase BshB1 [Acidobacteriaceae bacterium]